MVNVHEQKCIAGGAVNSSVNMMFYSVVDSDWAGDTFVRALRLALAAGADAPVAAVLVSAAAATVMGKDGTAACSALELRNFIAGATGGSADWRITIRA